MHTLLVSQSDIDLAVQLHFALFNGTGGCALKPAEMRARPYERVGSQKAAGEQCETIEASARGVSSDHVHETASGKRADSKAERSHDDDFWPPPRDALHRTTIDVLSLHHLPKVITLCVRPSSALGTPPVFACAAAQSTHPIESPHIV